MFLGNTQPSSSNFAPGKMALSFNSAKHQHVNHGSFWRPATVYTNFYFEALVKPDGVGQYIVSAGYGGAHCLLFGVNAVVNGYCTLTGNVFLDATPTSFSTTEGIPVNKWSRVAVVGDAVGTKITVIINGVPSSVVTGWGGQRRTPAETDSQMFIGGSDHQNFGGKIACVRHFEGTLPYASPHQTVINPNPATIGWTQVINGSTVVNASFLADYRTGLPKDWSLGLSGVKHDGFLAETSSTGNAGGTGFDYLQGGNIDKTKLPVLVSDEVDISHAETPSTPPVGVRIFDSFGRANNLKDKAWNLGSCEVGGNTWIGNNWGILNGKAFPSSTSAGIIRFTDTASDSTIELSKGVNGNLPTGVGANFGLVCKAVDGNNYNQVTVDEYGTAYVFQYVGGVYTGHLGAIIFGTNWTKIKVVTTGNQIQVYADNVLKDTQTMTQNLAGTGKGAFCNTPLAKVDSIAVY